MKKYYYWLDTFRFMSAFLVVLTHSRFWFFQPYGLLDGESKNPFTLIFFFLTSLGLDAVSAFFILSGFLVGGRTIEKLSRGEQVSPAAFALSRIVRIIIPLAVALLVNSLFNIIQDNPNDWWRIVGNLLCLQGVFVSPEPGIGVLWTMSYIVWFYVLIWSFVLMAQKKNTTVFGGIITFVVVLWVFGHMGSQVLYVFQVASGILAYYLAKRNFAIYIYIVSLVIAILSTGLSHLAGGSISFNSLSVDGILIKTIQIVSYAVFIGLSVKYAPQAQWIIRFESLMSKLSRCSYSLYLIHLPVIMMMVYCGVQRLPYVNIWSLLLYILGVLLCLLAAWLIYIFVEKPAEQLKRWILKYNFK